MFCVLLLLVTKEEMKLIFKDADPKKQIIASPIKSIAISLTSTVECKNIYKPFHEYAFWVINCFHKLNNYMCMHIQVELRLALYLLSKVMNNVVMIYLLLVGILG